MSKKKGNQINQNVFEEITAALNEGNLISFEIISGSMKPLIQVGDLIVVSKIAEPLKEFDILLFWDGESSLICHYLFHINSLPGPDGSETLVTRGLNNPGEDFPVPRHRVLGKVISHRISLWLRWKQAFKIAFGRQKRKKK